MDTFVSVEHARRAVLGTARVTTTETVALRDAVGRTLAAPIGGGPLPPFDTSAMDGFAVRLADLAEVPANLPITGTVHAGDAPPSPLLVGGVVAVMTGAPIPPGTDGIVPVEWAERNGDHVRIDRAPSPGQFLRPSGGALSAGSTVLDPGAVVTVGSVGLLAAVGAASVPVRSRPRVAVVATGDELVAPSESPRPGQIRDANGPGLAAQVASAGGVVVGPFVARDDEASIQAVLDEALGADILVFAGGISMGDRDLVRATLKRRGVVWSFWTVQQRPGKPLAAGTLDGRPVIALPGNPVSAAVSFEVYVRSLLAACLGRSDDEATEPAVLDAPTPKAPGLHTFARVTAHRNENGLFLRPAGDQASHAALSLIASDGLAHLPADWDEAPEGAAVRYQPWSWQ